MSAELDLVGIGLGLVVDSTVKSTLVLAGAAVLSRVLRSDSAASRHAVWAGALGALPALAAVSLWQRGAQLTLDAHAGWLVLWAVGVVLSLVPFVRGSHALLAARRAGRLQDGAVWTDAVDVPLTFANTVLMPAHARSWTPAQLRAARLHEAAHLQRGDWWIHVGAWLICALLWFHPLAWWARRQLMLEAERAADDVVLGAGVTPSLYAQQLLGLSRGPTAGLSIGQSATGTRVRAILGAPRRDARRWPAALLTLSLCAGTAPVLVGWALWVPAPPVIDCLQPGLLP